MERESSMTLVSDHLLSSLVNKASISEQVYECACAFIQHNIILQHKLLDHRPVLLFRIASAPFIIHTACLQLHFSSVSPACKNVCNYSSITDVDTSCTERDFMWGEKNLFLWCMGPRRKVPAKIHTSINKQSCTDLHQLSLSMFFKTYCL